MRRLEEITFRLPGSPEAAAFLRGVRDLLAGVPYAAADAAGGLVLTPPVPAAARPVTRMRLADVPAPEVALGDVRTLGRSGDAGDRDRLDLADLTSRLAGHVPRVDHTGVNLSITAGEWDDLVRDVAAGTTMYRYPSGEPWPFVLPSTDEEFGTDIGAFVVGREPRFELVHDTWSGHTTWQFALWTSLSRPALEELFPAPHGISLPGLEDIFRTVFVRHPWSGLEVRFDLCFAHEGPNDWETGEWLVTAGGRMR